MALASDVLRRSLSLHIARDGKILSLCITEDCLFVSHQEGISKVGLETRAIVLVVKLPNETCVLARFGADILFTNQKTSSVWHLKRCGDLEIFAGGEDGNLDGPAKTCKFKQPIGISVEFDSTVYVCDAQTNSIKLFPRMAGCADFLKAIGSLYEAFSVHCKGVSYKLKSINEAVALVQHCKETLKQNESSIRSATNTTGTLNGPQGHVSAKTVASVDLIEWGLKRLGTILEELDYSSCNLLSCMTLDIEHCHATVHTKQSNMSMLEYSRSFGSTMKESIKRITHWAAFYHTSKKSWYPKPVGGIPFLKVPTIQQLPPLKMSQENCEVLRSWAASCGAAVRQRTVRQETTMAKHGALPEYMYQRQCQATEKVDIQFVAESENEEDTEEQLTQEVADETDVFDESSDDEIIGGEDEAMGGGSQDELASATDFLFGSRSRYGRTI